MDSHRWTRLLAAALCLLIGFSSFAADAADPPQAARAAPIDAYVYAHPLVTKDMTRRISTNVAATVGTRAPMGQFARLREYPTAKFRDVTAANADTLYTVIWLDGEKEPCFVTNPLNRYNVSSRSEFKPNPDGSVDVLIQNTAPAENLEANWLPAPKGPFILILRLYYPQTQPPSILDESWKIPPVRKVD